MFQIISSTFCLFLKSRFHCKVLLSINKASQTVNGSAISLSVYAVRHNTAKFTIRMLCEVRLILFIMIHRFFFIFNITYKSNKAALFCVKRYFFNHTIKYSFLFYATFFKFIFCRWPRFPKGWGNLQYE